MGQQEAELRRVRNQLSDIQKEQTQLEQRLEAERQQQSHVEKSVKEAQSEIEKAKTMFLFHYFNGFFVLRLLYRGSASVRRRPTC